MSDKKDEKLVWPGVTKEESAPPPAKDYLEKATSGISQSEASRMASATKSALDENATRLKEAHDHYRELRDNRAGIMLEYVLGYFCSQCGRSKSEIERDGTNFSRHLHDVNGHPMPATFRQQKQKEESLDREIETAKSQWEQLVAERKHLEEQNAKAEQSYEEKANQRAEAFRRQQAEIARKRSKREKPVSDYPDTRDPRVSDHP